MKNVKVKISTADTELAAAYRLLNEALPLALKQLRYGGASALDQSAFWSAVNKLGKAAHIDVIDFGEDAGVVDEMFYKRLQDLDGL